MIVSFRNSDAKTLFSGASVRKFSNIRAVAERKLQMLHRAVRLDDLRIPPQNRLEKQKGDRKGQWSIRINDQWRICFQFDDGDASEVEIVLYH